jgi:hypothetical protein
MEKPEGKNSLEELSENGRKISKLIFNNEMGGIVLD